MKNLILFLTALLLIPVYGSSQRTTVSGPPQMSRQQSTTTPVRLNQSTGNSGVQRNVASRSAVRSSYAVRPSSVAAASVHTVASRSRVSYHAEEAFQPRPEMHDALKTNTGGGVVILNSNVPVSSKKIETTTVAEPRTVRITNRLGALRFYHMNMHAFTMKHNRMYGVQIAFSRELLSAQKMLKKYRELIKVRGIIIEDPELGTDQYRVILGCYQLKKNAVSLYYKVVRHLPCSFIISYE
jgi:hypothetical protein